MLALALLLMSGSDDEEMVRAIFAAQAQAKAAAASVPVQPPAELHDAVVDEHAELFEKTANGALAAVVTGAPRRTCKKDRLPEMCGHCSNPRAKGACKYRTGEWQPSANATEPVSTSAEPVFVGSMADTAATSAARGDENEPFPAG